MRICASENTMSNVSSRHSFAPLTKTSKPLSGQRLVRLIAKKDKDGGYASQNLTQSLFVSIPPVPVDSISEHISGLLPHIVALIESTQNEIIREKRIEFGQASIDESEFSISKCIEFLDSSATGSRLTTEYLQSWFVEMYSDAAAEFIAHMNKCSVEELSEEQLKKTAVLRDMFSGFASARYSPDIPKCKAMIRFGEFLGEGNSDSRMQGMIVRASRIKAEKEAEMTSDALGF